MERVIDAAEARAMTREQALAVLAEAGDELDKKRAAMLLAGPTMTLKDEVRMRDWFPMLPPLAMAVRSALKAWRLHA